jgi:adenosylcobinamide kinase / adenosylcobinamide-phosphate guanylyltransferase
MGAGIAGRLDVAPYPVNLRMRGRLAVVIGGGRVAAQQVTDLRAAGAEVLVIAPELSAPLAELAAGRCIRARRRGYLASDLVGAWLVLDCTDLATVNAAIEADAERHRIWCVRADNTADQGAGAGTRTAVTGAGDLAQTAATFPDPDPEPGPARGPEPGSTARSAAGVLVLGGARSGKSATAEAMLAGRESVHYVATGPLAGAGDAEWDTRVRDHQERRPAHWRTEETLDLDGVLAAPDRTPVLIDCLSTWLARVMEDCGVWSGRPDADQELAARLDRLVLAWQTTRRQVVAVSNEVGSGVVPATVSGRRYRDELGRLNARIAACCREVWLCTAGIAQRLR